MLLLKELYLLNADPGVYSNLITNCLADIIIASYKTHYGEHTVVVARPLSNCTRTSMSYSLMLGSQRLLLELAKLLISCS
jgi:hypothetical protein